MLRRVCVARGIRNIFFSRKRVQVRDKNDFQTCSGDGTELLSAQGHLVELLGFGVLLVLLY